MHKYEKFREWKCIDPWFQWSNKIEMAVVGKAFGLMQPSKTTLNLPSSSLHLCSPLKEIRRVKIHHQFTSFPK